MSGQATSSRWSNAQARDYYGGALMLLLGLGAVLYGRSYKVGGLTEMGAGFFPVALGVVLALLGALIAFGASHAPEADGEAQAFKPEWRGWFCIMTSIVGFILLGTHVGLLPATFFIVFVSALGDRRNTLTSAALVAAAISVLCIVVFSWALQLQFPLLMWSWS